MWVLPMQSDAGLVRKTSIYACLSTFGMNYCDAAATTCGNLDVAADFQRFDSTGIPMAALAIVDTAPGSQPERHAAGVEKNSQPTADNHCDAPASELASVGMTDIRCGRPAGGHTAVDKTAVQKLRAKHSRPSIVAAESC